MKTRFSKENVLTYLWNRIDKIQKQKDNLFDQDNGYGQVVGKGEKVNREYGAFEALSDLIYDIQNGDL